MSRYIDADALKEIIMDMRNHVEPSPCLPHQTMLIPDRMVCDKIDAMPTVDAVPVEWIKNYVKRLDENGNTFAAVQYEMMLDDYFADGERKDGEHDN